MNALKKVIYGILFILTILLLGTLGYEWVEEVSFLDAFFMTVITVTTVGFEEVFPLSDTGKIFTILIIFLGSGGIVYVLGQIFDIIIAGEIKKLLGRKKMDKKIMSMSNHYIICGFGRIGKIICEKLHSAKIPFVVVDKNEKNVELFEEKKYIYVVGDATREATLIGANIIDAKGLVSVVSSDSENVYIVLTAKGFNKNLFVVSRASDDEAGTKMFWAGADKVFSPYSIGGKSIANAIVKPNVSDFFELIMGRNDYNMEVGEFLVDEKSHLVGKKISESNIRGEGLIVIGIRKSSREFVFNPSPLMKFEVGDNVIVLGQSESLQNLKNITRG